jgi:uncharacterized damage-inducible protein DinB
MNPKPLSQTISQQLKASQDYFNRSTRVLEESDSEYCPSAGMMTAAQQVAHAAQTLDWFVLGASRPEGFDLDFEKHAKEVAAFKSLDAARKWLDESYGKSIAFFDSKQPEELEKPLPEGPVMGGLPISEVAWAMIEHTAHHRGALTVYSRMLGKVPVMPYAG